MKKKHSTQAKAGAIISQWIQNGDKERSHQAQTNLESLEERQQEFSREEIWRYLQQRQKERPHVQEKVRREQCGNLQKGDEWLMGCRGTMCHRRRRASAQCDDGRTYRFRE